MTPATQQHIGNLIVTIQRLCNAPSSPGRMRQIKQAAAELYALWSRAQEAK